MMLERRIGMNIAVDKTKQVAYESMKKNIHSELEGKTFNLKRVNLNRGEWINLKNELEEKAFMLLSELNRYHKNYISLSKLDILKDFQEDDKNYYFDFHGKNSSVRIVFKKIHTSYIQFSHIEENIFEQVHSLL
mgnify:CR=1 FL=1